MLKVTNSEEEKNNYHDFYLLGVIANKSLQSQYFLRRNTKSKGQGVVCCS